MPLPSPFWLLLSLPLPMLLPPLLLPLLLLIMMPLLLLLRRARDAPAVVELVPMCALSPVLPRPPVLWAALSGVAAGGTAFAAGATDVVAARAEPASCTSDQCTRRCRFDGRSDGVSFGGGRDGSSVGDGAAAAAAFVVGAVSAFTALPMRRQTKPSFEEMKCMQWLFRAVPAAALRLSSSSSTSNQVLLLLLRWCRRRTRPRRQRPSSLYSMVCPTRAAALGPPEHGLEREMPFARLERVFLIVVRGSRERDHEPKRSAFFGEFFSAPPPILRSKKQRI